MEKLLERILNIISNDAFPDEDKPFIIREVVATWNESSEQVPGANETWYDEKYLEEQKEIAFNQGYQKNAQEHWDNGYLKGVSDATAKCTHEHVAALHNEHWKRYNSGHADGLEQGRAEADELLDQRERKGYTQGYSDGLKKEMVQHAKDVIEAENKAYQECNKKHGSVDGTLSGIRQNGYKEGYQAGMKYAGEVYDTAKITYAEGQKNGMQQAINLLTMEMENI